MLNLPTQYSNAFSGRRPKASQVGDWLALDPEFESPQPETFEERIEQFRAAYMVQTDLRKAAEAQLDREIVSTMDRQDAIIGSSGERRSPLSVDESGDWEDPGSVFMYNGGDE